MNEDASNIDFKYVIQILKQFLLPFKKYISVIIFTVIMSMALTVIKEYMLKKTIDALIIDYRHCFIWLFLLFASDMLMELCYRVYDKFSITARPALKKNILSVLMNKLFLHSYVFYQNRTSTQLAMCISNVCEGVEDLMTLIFDDFLQCMLIIAFASIGVFLNFNLTFALLFMTWGLLWILAALYWGNNMYLKTRKLSDKQIVFSRNIADLLSEIFIVFSFYNQKHEADNVEKWANDMVDAEKELRIMQYKIWFIQGFVCALAHIVLIGYCVYLFSIKKATTGDISFIFGTTSTIYGKIWDLTKNVREFIETAGKVAQSMQVLESDTLSIDTQASGKALKIQTGEIIFDHVEFTYGNSSYNKPVFGGSDYIKIVGGSFVAIVGYSGSGKSTLVHLLMRLFEIQGGRILIDNQNISEISLSSLRQNIAIVPQDAGFFMNRTIAENIAYGMYDSITDEFMKDIIQAATQAQAHKFIMDLPNGYETRLLSIGLNLSIGQRQRLAIARGFLRDAAIFILDEATSALDNNTQLTIQDDLREVIKGKTTLMIAHRLNTVQYADKILVFDNGMLIQEGSHVDLIEQDGCYKELWSAQK